MITPKEKKERSLGIKLFLKGERCNSSKCAMTRKPYRPGMHGKKRRKNLSDFGRQLQAKQRIQFTFGLRDAAMRKLFKDSAVKRGLTGVQIINLLEKRLDSVVYLLGLAGSRAIARQFINHGHFLVNGHRVTIPSYQVKINDVIGIRPNSRSKKIFEDLDLRLKKYEPPSWLAIDKDNFTGKIINQPDGGDDQLDPNLVLEYYSR